MLFPSFPSVDGSQTTIPRHCLSHELQLYFHSATLALCPTWGTPAGLALEVVPEPGIDLPNSGSSQDWAGETRPENTYRFCVVKEGSQDEAAWKS